MTSTVSIKDVRCAESYTVALSETGDVYTWGRGSLGKLGNNSEQSEVYPHKVNFEFSAESIKVQKAKN